MKSTAQILWIGVSLAMLACTSEERGPKSTFYDRQIGPILTSSCATSPAQSKCHVSADDRGNALGNLSVESYDSLNLRRDLLVDYGPYGIPGLLLKVVKPFEMRLSTWEDNSAEIITTDIAHAGDSLLDFTSVSYTQLERWIENGATENNAKPKEQTIAQTGCNEQVGDDPAFDGSKDPGAADFSQFKNDVNSILVSDCAGGNCHGTLANSMYLTCGETPEQIRWNYFIAGDYVSADAPASEILRRSISAAQGGTYHEGGAIFGSASDARYQAVLKWAEAKGGPSNVPADEGFRFFARRVQPMLVKRGCMMLGCHSAAMFHDYRLRGAAQDISDCRLLVATTL